MGLCVLVVNNERKALKEVFEMLRKRINIDNERDLTKVYEDLRQGSAEAFSYFVRALPAENI